MAPRRATNLALQRLARTQILTLHWQRWEEGNWLEAVDLLPGSAHTLYQLLGRLPRATQEDALRDLVTTQQPLPGWHEAFLAWVLAQLDAGRTALPLDREDLETSAELLRALAALAALETPTLERSLSVRLFGTSKRLASLKGGLLRVLRRHDPDAALYGDDDDALLRAHRLDRAPEYVPLAGPLTLHVPTSDTPLTLEPFVPSVALPAPLLRVARVTAIGACAVVTVENLTSFSELCAVRPPDVLALYTGGFASPTAIGLLQAIRDTAPAIPLFHWGDLDAGGFRILAHLRAKLGNVGVLAMEPATFDAYTTMSQPLTTSDRVGLLELRGHLARVDCVVLIERLLAADSKLEQEAIPAAVALQPGRKPSFKRVIPPLGRLWDTLAPRLTAGPLVSVGTAKKLQHALVRRGWR